MINRINLENKNKAGIYKIINKINGNFYIGSAVNFSKRFFQHKSNLKKCKHHNTHLQRAYDKYGSSNFEFELFEIVHDVKIILQIEQQYLQKYYGQSNCYNMNDNVRPEVLLRKINEQKQIEFELLGPDDKLYKFKGFESAALALDLQGVKIQSVAIALSKLVKEISKSKSYKGWRLPVNKDFNYENYRKEVLVKRKSAAKLHNIKLLSPQGKVYGPIFNLAKFCSEHNVDQSILSNIIAKRTQYSNGWSLFEGSYEKPKSKNSKVFETNIVSPNNIIYNNISNLAEFCRSHDLKISSFTDLVKGKIKCGEHKGWKLLKSNGNVLIKEENK